MKYQLLITYYRQQTTPKLADRRYSLRLLFVLLLAGLVSTGINAQINVGATTPPDASAILQATSNNKGVLFPNLSATQRDAIANPAAGLVIFNITANQLQYNAGTAANKNWQPVGNVSGQQLPLVSLTNTLLPAPLTIHLKGVAVYNTTTGSGTTGVVPGIYVNDGTQWRPAVLAAAINFAATFTAGSLACTGTLAGTYASGIAMTAANTKTISITATATGPYTASADTQNGVSFSASGNITATGSNIIILTASGTPTVSGIFTYTVTVAGQTCTFNVTYAVPVATFMAGTIDCSGALAGTYNAYIAMAATNTKVVNITAATPGSYTGSTDTQNGVSFSSSGNATTAGSTAITFTASGIPTTSGTFTYTVAVAGQTCTFTITYTTPAATFTAGTIDCSGTLAGTYNTYIPMAATNTKVVNITAATPGSYTGSTDTQNGVSFSASSNATTAGGNSITFTASGTPTTSGTFTYTVTVAVQTCTFNVTYTVPVATFTAATLSCSSGSANGTYNTYIAMTGTNYKIVTVTNTTPGSYTMNTDMQNGVIFSGAGNLAHVGANILGVAASGTPIASGTFNYTVTLAGQTCSFPVTYTTAAATFTAGTIDCSGTLAGSYNTYIAMTAANTKVVNITTATPGSYNASTNTQNGVSFSASGNATTVGSTAITLTASGTPTASGTFTYTVTIAGRTCTFSVTYTVPVATFTAGTISCSTGGSANGTYNTYVPMTSANTKTTTITTATPGSYTISTDTQNGVTFAGAGNVSSAGGAIIQMIASGTPVASGTFTYTVTLAGQTCTFPVTYTMAAAIFIAGTIDCSGTLAGTYNAYIAMAAANTKVVNITTATPGSYTASTNMQNGVSFSASGTATTTGATTITFTANGTPTTSGSFTYTATISGQTCTFNVTFGIPAATFTSATMACSGTLAGTYNAYIAMTAANIKVVGIGVATLGTYTGSTDTQNGVSFSASGNLTSTGATTITFTGSGTPTTSGTFTYTANIAGQTCTFNVIYAVPVATFTASTIDCSGTLAGAYVIGTAMAASNTKVVNITVATPGTYTGSTNTVNGVSFSASGTATAAGSTAITFTASGTPTATGTFTYTITIAGQTCTFSVTVVKVSFTGSVIFSGSVNSSNGSLVSVPMTSSTVGTTNTGITAASILSSGNFIAPVAGSYAITLTNLAYTNIAGTNLMNGTDNFGFFAGGVYLYKLSTGGYIANVTATLTKGQTISFATQTCNGCSPVSNKTLTSATVTYVLQ